MSTERNQKRGKFLVLDGMDGSGKGTQLKLLKAFLEERNVPHIFTREPGGCPESEKIRERLLSDETISTQERFFLMWEARVLHIDQTILPALEAGKLVVCDRFDSSTWAYQVCGEEHPDLVAKFREFRRKLVEKVCPPDLYAVFDLEPEISRARVIKDVERGNLNHFDMKPIEFYTRVREGFKEFGQVYPFLLVNADRPPHIVFQDLVKGLSQKKIVL